MLADIFERSFCGLDRTYYFRQLFFGILIAGFLMFFSWQTQSDIPMPPLVTATYVAFVLACILLYPYSMFVYDGIMGFLMGDNVYFLPLIFILPWRFFVRLSCFVFAPVIGFIGLIALYFLNR